MYSNYFTAFAIVNTVVTTILMTPVYSYHHNHAPQAPFFCLDSRKGVIDTYLKKINEAPTIDEKLEIIEELYYYAKKNYITHIVLTDACEWFFETCLYQEIELSDAQKEKVLEEFEKIQSKVHCRLKRESLEIQTQRSR